MTNQINHDILIIKLFTNKDIYNKYYNYITKYLLNNYKVNNKLLYKLYRCLVLLHEEHASVSLEDIYSRLLREYPALPVDERELAQETLQKALESIFNESEVSTLVQTQYEAARASEIALKGIAVAEGKSSFQELVELVQSDPLKEQEDDSNVFYQNDLQGLYVSTKGTPGLRWPLACLNRSIGSLRPGDFGFFFARPETGKTTFLSHVVTSMVGESGKGCVWVNNEEGGNKVLLRCYQSCLALTTDELFKHIEDNQRAYGAVVGDRIKLVNSPEIHYRELERTFDRYRPSLIVIDQLDKLQGFDAERYDLLMKAKYQWAREMAKKFECAVIGVCQAGSTGENKKKLIMTDVDSSHTAKQGEADWILGIGRVDADGLENVRYFNIIKNKLVGDEDSDPNLRHGFFDALIEPEIGRYKDRITFK